MGKYLLQDARTLSKVIDKNVDLIVTSPPYFNLKDYGSANQIGYGQAYTDYLKDMKIVLEQSFMVTKDTGSMWLVVDTLKKDGEFILLPFDLCTAAKDVGWKLQEIVVWEKDRTLPYSRKGEMRNIFEYILFFVKTSNFKYYPKRITDYNFKEWWVKYPERYSVDGKIPTDIWNFPIPIQGSWGNSYIRHFCPLPSELIDRIIQLCTDPGDIVFDPFAGSGSVLAEAYKLKRDFFGCDLNPDFKNMFEKYLKTVNQIDVKDEDENKIHYGSAIKKLRILKFPSSILKNLRKNNKVLFENIDGVIVEPLNEVPSDKNKHWVVKYTFITKKNSSELPQAIYNSISKPPLTKYGVEGKIYFSKKPIKKPKFQYKWDSTHSNVSEFNDNKGLYIASNLKFTKKERELINSRT